MMVGTDMTDVKPPSSQLSRNEANDKLYIPAAMLEKSKGDSPKEEQMQTGETFGPSTFRAHEPSPRKSIGKNEKPSIIMSTASTHNKKVVTDEYFE